MKVLGTSWNLTTDTIFINGFHNLSSEVTAKTEAQQSVSRIYDSLNKAVHSETVETRKRSGQDVQSVTATRMEPRMEPLSRYIGGDEHQLLCFTDASAKAY